MPAAAPFRGKIFCSCRQPPRRARLQRDSRPAMPACKETAAPFLPAEERGRLQNSEDPLQERYIPSKILHSTFRMRSFDSLRSLRMTGGATNARLCHPERSGEREREPRSRMGLFFGAVQNFTFYILHSTFYIGGQARYSETSSPRTRSALFSSSRRNRGRGCSRRRSRSVKRAE